MVIDVEGRVQSAVDYFMRGYNCTQAVVLAFQDILGADEKTIGLLTVGLGGGVSRLREVCGTVLAMAVVAGSVSGAEGLEPHQQKMAVYPNVQKMAARFREENGAIVCRELLGLRAGEKQDPQPEARDNAYYQKRPCLRYVGSAARIIAEFVQTQTIAKI